MASKGSTSFRSVPEMWHHRCASVPDADAYYSKRDGLWQTHSWRQVGDRSRVFANGLLALGIGNEQRVCILAQTSLEWILADMAILCAGGATSTIYPSSTPDECAYIAKDCGAAFIFCDTNAQVDKLRAVQDQLGLVQHVIVFQGRSSADGWVMTLSQLERMGEEHAASHPDAYDERSKAIGPEQLATLIYTSGTTGQPKGVMLTHDSWVYESEGMDRMGIMTPADKQLLFLPLSHVFAKVMQIIAIRLGVPTAVDGNIDDLATNMGEIQPTWMGAVPRVFEKVYNKIVHQAKGSGRVKYSLFKWAVGVGTQVSQLRQKGQRPSGSLKLKAQAADRLVFNKVKRLFGGRMRFLISGGAPLSQEIAEFFHACDILILEGYGLTESSAASCVNRPDDFRFGSVGPPVPGTEVKIAEDGEIMLRGRGIMKGYYNQPQATAEAIDAEGWLHTGDIGVVLDSGHLKITDRKKEIIVTAGGKNIAPAHVQGLLKARSDWVEQVLMHGDRRSYCVALIAIDEQAVGRWARDHDLRYTDYADLASKPEVHALVWADVQALNRELPSYETLKKVALVPEPFSIENGLLTPSFKVKRRAVEARYTDELEAFYEGSVEEI